MSLEPVIYRNAECFWPYNRISHMDNMGDTMDVCGLDAVLMSCMAKSRFGDP